MINATLRKRPGTHKLDGQYVTLMPMDWSIHAPELAKHVIGKANNALWDYMSIGPFETNEAFIDEFRKSSLANNWETLSVYSHDAGAILGTASFMRIRESHASAEIGFVLFSRQLQKTRAGSEVIFLMLHHLFDELGYRRVEWKCNTLNEKSKRAAKRFGFTYEGLFRQDLIVKGRNRDTAWFSMLDKEWPSVSQCFRAWLSPSNFDKDCKQKSRLCID